MRSAEKLKNVFCKNGGAFIKVGQHIGGLDYLLPDEYVNTMKQLHNKAPESDITELFSTIETDLNCKVSKIFNYFINPFLKISTRLSKFLNYYNFRFIILFMYYF